MAPGIRNMSSSWRKRRSAVAERIIASLWDPPAKFCSKLFAVARQPCRHSRYPQLRHGRGGKDMPAGSSNPAGPERGAAGPRAIGRDAGVGVHLTVELGDEHEG